MAVFNQTRDQVLHFSNIMCGAGFDIGGQHVHGCQISMKLLRCALGQGRDIFPIGTGAGGNLVINIGNVAHKGYAGKQVAQQAHQHICRQHRTQIANMGQIIHGWPTIIDLHMLRIERCERHCCAALAVVQRKMGHMCWL